MQRSSSNLLRFNVEDIFALPQLKAGKFTKNIQSNDLKKGINEVVEIMDFQSRAKGISVNTVLKGFP